MSPPQDERPASSITTLPASRQQAGPDLRERSHERLRAGRISGAFALRLTATDPVHIGSGTPALIELSNGPQIVRSLVVQQMTVGNVPVIPGSSIKGSVRSLAEAMAGGCDLMRPCRPTCFTCALFGHAERGEAFAARVGFEDALPLDPDASLDQIGISRLPVGWRPRNAGGRRIYGPPVAERPGEVPYEVINRGAVFLGRLHLINVSRAELGLVLLCLGLDGSFQLRIGGGKFAGLGRTRITLDGARLRSGYERPVPDVLDGAAANELARQAMAEVRLSDAGKENLQRVRAAMGGAADLSRYRTPRTAEPVDPARLAEVARFLQQNPSSEEVRSFLKLMPGSYMQKVSQSAGPQLMEVSRVVGHVAQEIPNTEELRYTLGWARRLLQVAEEIGMAGNANSTGRSDPRRAGPARTSRR